MQDFNNSDDFNYEQDMNQAQDAAAHAAQQTPRRGSWGIESFGDGPAALGGGFGGFLWFASQEDLLEFVASQIVFAYGVAGVPSVRQVSRRARAKIDAIREGKQTMAESLEALNWVLKGCCQLRWWGDFDALLSGEGEFEKKIRASYREDSQEHAASPDTSPIRESEVDKFVTETLLVYGI